MKTAYQNCLILLLTFSTIISSAQIPILNSYPTSSNTIFLDFDGHTVTGSSWNSNGAITCDASTLNASQVTTIFNRVAEDYRPFNLNITTDSTRYWSAPAHRRMRVILTTSSSWYGAAGGVAYINSFNWADNTPCFVFTALLNNNTKNIAEATSHEIGHTLGLRHQSSYDAVCNKVSEYNAGRGAGEIGWAPIMGVGYYQNMTLWNYGANPFGCNAYQDDLSIITSNDNGITFRADDHANTTASASPANFSNNTFTVSGIIEKPADIDVIKFTTIALGRVIIDAVPYSVGSANTGSNLDIEVELLKSTGDIMGTYNSDATLGAAIDTSLDPGTYFLRVKGRGNIYAPNYASLGSYTLAANFSGGSSLPLHKLRLKGITENKKHKLDWEIVADEKIVTLTLEASTNGSNYLPVAELGATARAYSYSPPASTLLYYRLKLVLDNGRQHYSNVVALRNNGSNGRPYLIGTVVTSTITINSPAAYTYSIYDFAGRTVAKGSVIQGVNTINPSLPGNGIYMIQFQNNAEFYTEKFTRR